jgi:DNA-binding response OmpR family regulator
MHIAVLDDNLAILDYLTNALSLGSHTVSTYTTGRPLLDALFPNGEVADPLSYDLLILDRFLPEGLSGEEVVREIRTTLAAAQLPIILITAGTDENVRLLRAIFPDLPVLRKPFHTLDLLRMIDSSFIAEKG